MAKPRWPCRQAHRSLFWMGGAFLLLPSARAQAHTTFPGLGEFAGGFLHPLTTPTHLLVLAALGIFLGQHAPLRLKEPAAAFAGAAALGLGLTVILHVGGVPAPGLVVLGLVVGGGVVAGFPLPWWVKALVCGVAALVLGLDSGVEATASPAALAKTLAGTWISLVLCLVNVAFYVSLLPAARWAQTGLRVLGSWIVAIAFLLLAFALRR